MGLHATVSLFAVLVAVFLACVPVSVADETKGLCDGNQATSSCLKRNFRGVYQTNYKSFWKIIYSSEEKALNCNSIPRTVEFLEFAREIKGNAEVGEYFSETVERKFLSSNPQCFLDALIRADEESQRIIIGYLRTPIFSDKTTIRGVLSKYKDMDNYRAVLKSYFRD